MCCPRGMFDPAHVEAVKAGSEEGGTTSFDRGRGIFSAKAKAGALAKSAKTRTKCFCGDCKTCKSRIHTQKSRLKKKVVAQRKVGAVRA